ncbi:uncharacterized protein [Penaeus vannamei]|uniref:uncharacterized protein n=1 Tax=Penaeus vannamei TaxID=6689 RepID=UPI00387F3AD5
MKFGCWLAHSNGHHLQGRNEELRIRNFAMQVKWHFVVQMALLEYHSAYQAQRKLNSKTSSQKTAVYIVHKIMQNLERLTTASEATITLLAYIRIFACAVRGQVESPVESHRPRKDHILYNILLNELHIEDSCGFYDELRAFSVWEWSSDALAAIWQSGTILLDLLLGAVFPCLKGDCGKHQGIALLSKLGNVYTFLLIKSETNILGIRLEPFAFPLGPSTKPYSSYLL